MKKILLLLFLIPVFAAAQKTTGGNYTYIAQRYEWLTGIFQALNLPAGDSAQHKSGQDMRSGAIYLDTLNTPTSPAGLYIYKSGVWELQADEVTQSALNDTAAAIRGAFPGTIYTADGSFSGNRTISWNTGVSSGSSLTLRSIVGGSSLTSGHFALTYVDTVPNPDVDANKSVGFYSKRIYRIPSYTSTTYRTGANIAVDYEINDSVKLNSVGGDFGGSVRTDLQFKKLSGYSGRSVYVIGAETLQDGIPVHLANVDWGGQNSTAGVNYKYIKGYLIGHQSYMVGRANDTLENWVGFHNTGFINAGYVKNTYDYIGGYTGFLSSARVANPWGVFIFNSRSRNYFAGALNIGDSSATPSALLNVTSTTKGVVFPRMNTTQQNAIASPLTGLMIFNTDSLSYCFFNGTAWVKMGTGSGGATPGIDDVLAVGQSLTTNRTINTNTSGLTISGSPASFGATLNLSNSSTEGQALSASSNGLSATIFSNNTKTTSGGGWAFYGQSVGSVPTGTLIRDSSSTNTVIPVLNLIRRTTGTAANGIGGSILFGTETGGSDFNSNEIASKWVDATQLTRTSELDIYGVNSGTTETHMNIQTGGIVRVNNNADTLATKAYARSVGGGSGLTVGTTTITSGTNTRVLYNNSGVLGEYSVTGSGTTVPLSTSPDFTTGITIGSVAVPTISSTNTLTNKRITARYGSTSSSATPTVNTDDVDVFEITALAVDITSMTTNLSGTPNTDDVIHFIITGTATRAITWGSSFENSTVSWPTTTNGTNRLDVYGIWNATTSKWRCTGVH